MVRSYEQCRRLAAEEKLMKKYMRDFHFYNRTGNTYIKGEVQTSGRRNKYTLKLTLPSDFPYDEPYLYVASPNILWQYGHQETVNSEGTSHAFHTTDNGSDNCIKICHTHYWDPSITCVKIILKGILWLEAYEGHLRTGKDLAEFLC